jgi:transcriptional regulator with XRE-family HTH domain
MKEHLREKRMNAKLTQEEAGKRLGVGQSTVAMWETGGCVPRTEMLPKIADLYGCSIADLF